MIRACDLAALVLRHARAELDETLAVRIGPAGEVVDAALWSRLPRRDWIGLGATRGLMVDPTLRAIDMRIRSALAAAVQLAGAA